MIIVADTFCEMCFQRLELCWFILLLAYYFLVFHQGGIIIIFDYFTGEEVGFCGTINIQACSS